VTTGQVEPLPAGFQVRLDPVTRTLDEHTLVGGAPLRVLRLSPTGRSALAELLAGPIRTSAAGKLARTLTDGGLAFAQPPSKAEPLTVTVVIPVRGRAESLDRCLAALGGRHPVIVVDDASVDPTAVARVAEAHGAALIRRPVNGGAGAARNTALAVVDSDVVAFLDSDCIPESDWIDRLIGHLADPLVAIAAPRITPRVATSAVGRYDRVSCSLDLGPRPAVVAPGTPVAYVPTAALVARCSALRAVAAAGAVFDESMRVGEDVDLVWRLHADGWRVRYDPAICVDHEEPSTWKGLLARRHRYGTSAAPLAHRHPDNTMPLVLVPAAALAVAGVLTGRPVLALSGVAGTVVTMHRALRLAGLPSRYTASAVGKTLGNTWLGIGRYVNQFALPVALAAVVGKPSPRRTAMTALVLSPAVHTWLTRRPDLDIGRTALAQLADDFAYGTGVWSGCVQHRTLRPLKPVLRNTMRRAGENAALTASHRSQSQPSEF
jgi:mycofactocin system glycosyltransferase